MKNRNVIHLFFICLIFISHSAQIDCGGGGGLGVNESVIDWLKRLAVWRKNGMLDIMIEVSRILCLIL